jgi:3-oxoadipate enol-lactonase
MTGISIGGLEFNAIVEGSENKPALMLSNPLGTNLHIWYPQLSALLDHFRIVRYDSRGHGNTPASRGPYSIEELGRDALAILDTLGIEKAHWLGLSMGSVVGLWLLINAPGRIGRAVLAGTAAQMPGPEMWNSRIQSARESGMENAAEAAAERWFTKQFSDAEPGEVERVKAMVRATSVEGYVASCAALRDIDLREAVRGITNRVLIITGRHDMSTPPGMGALAASAIPGAQLVTLDAPHLSNIEDAANFNKAVLDFLKAPETSFLKARARRRAASKKAASRAPARRTAAKKAAAKKAAQRQPAKTATAAKKSAAKRAVSKRPRLKAAPRQSARKSVAKKGRKGAKRGVKQKR